jgi:hypothetical protein
MDLTMLKKKISSYRTPKGSITKLPDELLGEILSAWELWAGSANGFYVAIGTNHHKMASIMGKAKKLKREGAFDGLDFTEVFIEGADQPETNKIVTLPSSSNCGIELVWDNNKIIRFGTPDLLVEFLKKAA